MEGQYFRKNGELISFSEENLIDCPDENKYGINHKCISEGGILRGAFEWLKDNGGLANDTSYKYVAEVSNFELIHLVIPNSK